MDLALAVGTIRHSLNKDVFAHGRIVAGQALQDATVEHGERNHEQVRRIDHELREVVTDRRGRGWLSTQE